MENDQFDELLNKNCLDTMTLSTLMFQYIKKNNDSINDNSLVANEKDHIMEINIKKNINDELNDSSASKRVQLETTESNAQFT